MYIIICARHSLAKNQRTSKISFRNSRRPCAILSGDGVFDNGLDRIRDIENPTTSQPCLLQHSLPCIPRHPIALPALKTDESHAPYPTCVSQILRLPTLPSIQCLHALERAPRQLPRRHRSVGQQCKKRNISSLPRGLTSFQCERCSFSKHPHWHQWSIGGSSFLQCQRRARATSEL